MKLPWNAVLLTACCTVSPAHAQSLDGQSILQQFNLVTLGDASIHSHVDGRSYVGGNLIGQGAVLAMHPADMPASPYTGLTVAGNASDFQVTAGGMTVVGNVSNGTVNNGPAVVGGNVQGASFNGTGGAYVFGSSSGVNRNSGSLSSTAAQSQLATASSTNFGQVHRAQQQDDAPNTDRHSDECAAPAPRRPRCRRSKRRRRPERRRTGCRRRAGARDSGAG